MAQNIIPSDRFDGHEKIVQLIHSLSVGSGQSLRQVMVPDVAYTIARKFLKWAPNITFGTDNRAMSCRFKVLHRLPFGGSIYSLLVMDAGNTSLTDAEQKIEEWKEAVKSLLRYALNLKLAPKRPEFQRMKLSSSYYVYQVAKKLRGAENMLLCMGYEPVSGSAAEIQELKYGGEVNTLKVIHTAADLVILHSEMERIRDLVLGAKMENYRNVLLCDILEARGERSDSLDTTLRRSLTCYLARLTRSRQPQFPQAPALPPCGQYQPAQLPAVTQGQHLSLEHQEDYQNLFSHDGRSSAPNTNPTHSGHWRQPPPISLLNRSGPPVAPHTAIPPPITKDSYENLDKTMDKFRGKGIDSAKYNAIVPDPTAVASSPVSTISSIPDSLNLPEPAFDTHDLEMFHQEARNLDDYSVSGNMSLLINARSAEFGDYSGPDLDDQLAYRSHDSGLMGLSDQLPTGSALGNTGESGTQLQEKDNMEHDDASTSAIHGDIAAQHVRVKDIKYEDVELRQDKPSSNALFHAVRDVSVDSQASDTSMDKLPVPRPRSVGRGEKSLNQSDKSSLPSRSTSRDLQRPPLARPRSHHNLQSLKGSQESQPSSPSRIKPAVSPRKATLQTDKSKESRSSLSDIQVTSTAVSSEDMNATAGICLSQPLLQVQESLTTKDSTTASTCTSQVTSIDSSSSDHLHSEAHSSLDSGSPHPSLESKPNVSNKSNPCSSTPSEEASSAYSGEKLVIKESSEDKLCKESKNALSSLDSQPRSRERALAFSNKSEKATLNVEKPTRSTRSEDCHAYSATHPASAVVRDIHTDIQNAKPCWYCTNLTTLEICDVCGNAQSRRETTA